MRAKDLKHRMQAATVRLTSKVGGQGVLVPGGYILTACHCINWEGTGGMVLGDYCVEEVETRDGSTFHANVCAVEPRSDIAVLSPAGNQEMPADCEAFEAFASKTEPVELYTRPLPLHVPLPVQLLTHKAKWINGKVIRYGMPGLEPDGMLYLETDARIEPGTSGGPVIEEGGSLVGIVSNSPEDGGAATYTSTIPVPWLALPRWIGSRIAKASRDP